MGEIFEKYLCNAENSKFPMFLTTHNDLCHVLLSNKVTVITLALQDNKIISQLTNHRKQSLGFVAPVTWGKSSTG